MNSQLGADPTSLPSTSQAIAAQRSLDCPKTAQVEERRAKPRIRRPFPATVSGVDRYSRRLDLTIQLENISSRGLYLHLCEEGTAVLRATLRIESGPRGLNGIALAIQRYEFI